MFINKNVAKLISRYYKDLEILNTSFPQIDHINKIVVCKGNGAGYIRMSFPQQNLLSELGYKAYNLEGKSLMLYQFGKLEYDIEETQLVVTLPSSGVKHIFIDRPWLKVGDKMIYDNKIEFTITNGPFNITKSTHQYKINRHIVTEVGKTITKI